MVSCCRHIFRHIHKEQTLYQTVAIVISAETVRCDSDRQTCVWTFADISCVSLVWHTQKEGQKEEPPNNDFAIILLTIHLFKNVWFWYEHLHFFPQKLVLNSMRVSKRWHLFKITINMSTFPERMSMYTNWMNTSFKGLKLTGNIQCKWGTNLLYLQEGTWKSRQKGRQ